MVAIQVRTDFDQAVDKFNVMTADCQLAILLYLHQHVGRATRAAALPALFSQSVHHLLRQVRQVRQEDRIDVLRDILTMSETRFSREYQAFNVNLRLAFWYRLFQEFQPNYLNAGLRCPIDTQAVQGILATLDGMDLNQQVYFLREILQAD